jgi:NO-binding membrane sensor protein with MHYT domain
LKKTLKIFGNPKLIKMKNVGIVLIVIGIAMMAFTGFTFITKKKVVDVGPLEINKEEKNPVSWSPIIGGIILASGVVVLLMGRRKA